MRVNRAVRDKLEWMRRRLPEPGTELARAVVTNAEVGRVSVVGLDHAAIVAAMLTTIATRRARFRRTVATGPGLLCRARECLAFSSRVCDCSMESGN